MLQFFVLPVFPQPRLQLQVAVEMFDQVMRVQIRAALHERGAAKQKEEIFVMPDTGNVDVGEIKTFQGPWQDDAVVHSEFPVQKRASDP